MLKTVLEALGLTHRVCSCCGKIVSDTTQGHICNDCLSSIKPLHPINYGKLQFVSSYRMFAKYEGMLAQTLREIKFKSVLPLARILGGKIKNHLGEFLGETKPDLITYVPVHTFRFWKRGFDHNEEILKGAGVNFQRVLLRRKHSKPLARLSKDERVKVLKDAFGVRKEFIDLVESKRVLVFDDILTTGATSTSVAELLLSLGAEEVYFYFVAGERV